MEAGGGRPQRGEVPRPPVVFPREVTVCLVVCKRKKSNFIMCVIETKMGLESTLVVFVAEVDTLWLLGK